LKPPSCARQDSNLHGLPPEP